MKFKSLYRRLLVSFLGILFVTIFLILALFLGTAGRGFRDALNNQAFGKLKIFQRVLQEKIDGMPGISLNENNEVKELLHIFSDLFNLKIWITASDNTLLLKTFSTSADISLKKNQKRAIVREGIELFYLSRRHISYYAKIPITSGNAIHTVHIYHVAGHTNKPEALFLFGLLSIGVVIAGLIIPLTKIITSRIKQLNRSALQFADGNLDQRISIKGRDEIAELGNSFNFMADKLEKMIQGNKELTANISHELRSPLTRIRVSNEMIQDRLLPNGDEDIKRYAKNIENEIQILDTLIEKILMLSKLDLQESSLSAEPLDFNLMIKDLEKKFSPSLKHKHLSLVLDMSDSLILDIDKTRVATILMNLMDNAVKHTHENGAIRINASKPTDDSLILSITNTFRPLNSLELERIFEPFYRIEPGQNPGSGLGLSIVKKMAAQCKSHIRAKNSETGLTFEIRFQGQCASSICC
ncbi:MAG: HAMP domain-containing sensor histidine kinase [Desulfobacteraceae bacterium]|nr:HAMP domain-containing sensor histidine kinase [Desulfobacteraceae bacterium]